MNESQVCAVYATSQPVGKHCTCCEECTVGSQETVPVAPKLAENIAMRAGLLNIHNSMTKLTKISTSLVNVNGIFHGLSAG